MDEFATVRHSFCFSVAVTAEKAGGNVQKDSGVHRMMMYT